MLSKIKHKLNSHSFHNQACDEITRCNRRFRFGLSDVFFSREKESNPIFWLSNYLMMIFGLANNGFLWNFFFLFIFHFFFCYSCQYYTLNDPKSNLLLFFLGYFNFSVFFCTIINIFLTTYTQASTQLVSLLSRSRMYTIICVMSMYLHSVMK